MNSTSTSTMVCQVEYQCEHLVQDGKQCVKQSGKAGCLQGAEINKFEKKNKILKKLLKPKQVKSAN